MRKRGQTEILGILIVVFIVSIGLFYVVSLKLSQGGQNTFILYQDTELAHATILALLKSDIDGCFPGTLEDNIKKLGSNPGCDLRPALEKILSPTIGPGRLNKIYAYEIYSCDHVHNVDDTCVRAIGPSDYEDEDSDTYKCLHTDYDASSNVQPIETDIGLTYNFKLVICRN